MKDNNKLTYRTALHTGSHSADDFLSHPISGRLPLLSARPTVTLPAEGRHHPLTGTKLYCLMTEAQGVNIMPQVVEQMATVRLESMT